MTNEAEGDIEESIKIGPGDLLAFGSINLLFTLYLNQKDISKYKIKWEELENLNNLKFIRKHKSLWKRIEISSNDDTMNILLNINKTSKKIIRIGYVGLKKMIFEENQIDFQDFIIEVAKENGLQLTSCDVCKCTITVQLLLKYENEEKIFILTGKPTNDNNEENKNNEDNKDNKNANIENKDEKENEENNNKEENKNNDDNKEDKNNNNEEGKKEGENNEEIISNVDGENEVNNPFINVVDHNISPREFNYVYFNFNDYTNGEFKGKIKLEHLFEYFQDIKIRTKAKIILNFQEEAEIFKNKIKDEIFKDLLSITDLFIFYNKNKLYEVLKELKEEEDKDAIDYSYKLHYFESQRKIIEKEKNKKNEEEWEKKYKNFLEKYREKEKKIPKHLKTDGSKAIGPNIYITQETINTENNSEINKIILHNQDNESKNESLSPNMNQLNTEPPNGINTYRDYLGRKSKSQTRKINLLQIKPSPPKPLNKNDMFYYFKNGIFNRDPQKKSTDKIILVLDEFNKIFIVKCNKQEEKPLVLDFDLKLYPQMNIRNMNDILKFKKFMRSKFSEYVRIFMGNLLGVITGKGKDGCEEDSLFLGYLLATNTIKKISEIQRYDLPLPRNKEFFYPSINKNELEKILIEAEKRKKERAFVLDGNNKNQMVIKPYNPLLDKNLYSFLNSRNNKLLLKNKGFIGKNGKIMYDPIYRETLGFDKTKNYNSIPNITNMSNIKSKISNDKKMKSPQKPTNKFLVGFRLKSPGYSIYNERLKKKVVLPPIIPKKQPENHSKKKYVIEEKSEDETSSNVGSGNVDISENRSGEGSGKSDE